MLRIIFAYLRMNYVDTAMITTRFAEDHIVHTLFVGIFQRIDTREPYRLEQPIAIGEEPQQTLARTLPLNRKSNETPSDLNVGHIFRYLADSIVFTLVDVSERKVVEEVAKGVYVEFVAKNFSSFLADSLQIFYVTAKKIRHPES